eukprot:TRINITY_DN6262_c0_g1_i1.p1 TRINITY_DN6262_c0_g1~~TRINITY_DN6262_c0_g1_i1.p1  ORF type:complete len:220 (+),score=29.89 TRINITY_DN6262_c0_g1_i1:32-661(+)
MAEIILHVRNIPCKVVETSLRDTMQEVGLDVSRYEIYLPKKLGRQGRYNNFGYGFVTCWRSEDAEAFIRTMRGFCFENINSHKLLLIEPARSNVASGPVDIAFGQPGALDAVHAATPASYDRQSAASSSECLGISSESGHLPRNASVAEHDAARPAAYKGTLESFIGARCEVPDVSQVPATRLAFDERFMDAARKALLDESSRTLFRFQ